MLRFPLRVLPGFGGRPFGVIYEVYSQGPYRGVPRAMDIRVYS